MYRTFSNIGNNVTEQSCGPSYQYNRPSINIDSYTGHTGHSGYTGHNRSNGRKNVNGPYNVSDIHGHNGHTGHTGHTGYVKQQIPGSLGVYSGDEEMPYNGGNLYRVGNSYQVMDERQKTSDTIHFISQMGLYPMQDYKVVDNPIGGKGYYYVQDGRVVDSARNIRMVLDKPAEVGAVDMDQVSTFDNRNYGSVYKSYSDIKNGQISYYINNDVAQPFISPVYTLSSYVDKTIRIDPMDSPKPEYIKTPVSSTLYSVSKDQSTRDQLSFREDLMSRQQNLYNRTSWTNRWVAAPPFV